MKKNLRIASFDLETTGVDTNKDRIVQIACKLQEWNSEENVMYTLRMFESYVNPGITIPLGASEVHGITDEMVKNAPKLEEISDELMIFFGLETDCLSGYNIGSFDVPLLLSELDRISYSVDFSKKIILDTFKINNHFNPRTLSNVYRNYTKKQLEDAHNAMADVNASDEVLMCQLERHELNIEEADSIELLVNNGKPRVDFAQRFTTNEKGEYVFNFGKNQGKNVFWEKNYLRWMLGQDFSNDTKNWIEKFLLDAY
jgi:DNA polymerase-3 subunit epsilon